MLDHIKKLFNKERKSNNMKKVLYITANPKSENDSYSLSVGRAFIDAYKHQNPEDEIIELDVYKTELPYVDTDVFSGWGKLQQGVSFDSLADEEKRKVSRINELTDQFMSADKYVLVTPLWNFSIPPKMKAYIDTICIAGKTFKYTENGPIGLLTGKKAVHIQASGGIYSQGPASDFEFGDKYVKAVCGFLGIQPLESILIEGIAATPDKAEEIKNSALQKAEKLAVDFANT